MSRKNVATALRVAQLDTTELDDNVMQLLANRLRSCFQHKIANIDFMQYEPHFRTALYGLLLYNTLWIKKQTIGQKLLGLRYGDYRTLGHATKRRLIFLQVMLIIGYWTKSAQFTAKSRFFKHKIVETVSRLIESSLSLISLFNLMFFLRQGHFHTLLLRIAGLRTVYVRPDPPQRNISFHLMSRDLLWHGFAETGVFFLSFINVNNIRRKIFQVIFPPDQNDARKLLDSCAFCKSTPIMPYEGSCQHHAYCYYCVATVIDEDSQAKCPSCNHAIEFIKPLRIPSSISESAINEQK